MTPPTTGPTDVTAAYPAAPVTRARTAAPLDPGPSHLAHRRRHPTPWAQVPGRPPSGPDGPAGGRPGPAPVFVDDTGRRRRAGRWIGAAVGVLVVGYVAVLVMAFAGVPLTGPLAPPGVEQLSRSATDRGVSVAPGARERPLPPAPGVAPADASASAAPSDADGTATGAPATTADVSASTTTTTAPGNGATTTVPTPSSTVPDRTRPTGRPSEPPGRS